MSRAALWWTIILVIVALVVATFIPLSPQARIARHHLWRTLTFPFPDDVRGIIQAQGKTLGDFRMNVDECDSGDWHDFYGMQFHDGSQPGYGGHVSMPADGEPAISLNAPAHDYAIEFYKSDCSVWDVKVERAWSLFRDHSRSRIKSMKGHARFSCYHPDTGARIDGDLRFRYCN